MSATSAFDLLADALPYQIWKGQPGGPVRRVNRRMCDYFGASADELIELSWDELIHPDDLPRMRACWNRALKTKNEAEADVRLRKADGSYHWHQAQILPRRDNEGDVVEWIGIHTLLEDPPQSSLRDDLLDPKKARAAQRRYRELLRDLDAIVWELDASTSEFTYVSPQIEEILGYPVEQWLKDPEFWVRTVHPDDRSEVIAHRRECIEEGKRSEIEYRALTHEGDNVWLRDMVNVVTDGAGNPGKVRGVMIDITERKQMERHLQESEERFRDTFEQAAVGIAHVSPDGTWLRINQTFCEIVGYSKEELSHLTYQDITHPEDLRKSERVARQLVEGEIETAAFEKRYIRKDGSTVWIHLTTTMKRDASGEAEYFISVFEDITDKKAAEQRLSMQYSVTRLLAETRTLEEVAPQILQTIGEHMDWKVGMLWQRDTERERLECTAIWEDDTVGASTVQEIVGDRTLEPGTGFAGRIWEKKTSIWHSDLTADEEFPQNSLAAHSNLQGALGIPVMRGKKVVGVMELYTDQTDRPRGELLNTLEALGDQIGEFIERSRTETALRKSEKQFRTLTEALPDIVWIALPDGTLTYVNERWIEHTETSREKVLHQGWRSFLHPDDEERTVRAWEDARQDVEVFEIEHRVRTAEDEYHWYLTRALPLRGSDGEVERWLGTSTDIHETKELEEELRKQTQTLKTINEAGTALAAELDLKELVQAVTDAGTEITGAEFGAFFYNKENQRGESYMLYTLSGAPKEAFEDFPHPRNTEIFGPTFRGEEVVRLNDVTEDPRYGNNPPFHGMPEGHLPVCSYMAVPVISRSGETIGGLFFGHQESGVFTAQDENIITGIAAQAAVAIDNARLYQTARENEERFRAVTENAVDIIATVDRHTEIQYISPSVEAILGYSPDELVGSQLTNYIHPDDVHRARNELIAVTLVPEEVGSFTLRFKDRDQSTRHLSIKARNMQERPGVEGLLLNIRDVTDVKRYERELIEAKETAEQMTRVKTNLLANMSHEIRTPLTAILGLTEGLEQKVSEEYRDEIELIEQSGQRLMDTLNSVMALAQLEGGEVEISQELLDVTETVRNAAVSLEDLAVEKGLSFEVRSDAPRVKAPLDRTLVVRILNNLVSNAIKFTDEGSITVHISASDEDVTIAVSDTGMGISEEFQPHLFDEFKQESTGLSRSHEGIGLGLVLTRKMVDLMGGTISFESEKGSGSTFAVTFPRASDENPTQEPEQSGETETTSAETTVENIDNAESPSTRAAPHVLLVEDNEIIRRVIVERLQADGEYDVEAFVDAESALQRAQEQSFDVVLMDISLPEMDGIEALQELRTSECHAQTPVIAITGHALPGDRERFLEQGFSAYLAKPFSAEDLAETIHRAQ